MLALNEPGFASSSLISRKRIGVITFSSHKCIVKNNILTTWTLMYVKILCRISRTIHCMRETHHALVCDASEDISNQETEFLPKPEKLEIVIAITNQYLRASGNSG